MAATSSGTITNLEDDLLDQLRQLNICLNLEDREATLSTLRRIFDNIIQHPSDEKYRQIKLTSETLNSKVWQYPAGEKLMKMSGWVVDGGHVRLRDSACAQVLSSLLKSLYEQSKLTSKYVDAVWQGDGPKLRSLLQQTKIPACNICCNGFHSYAWRLFINRLELHEY